MNMDLDFNSIKHKTSSISEDCILKSPMMSIYCGMFDARSVSAVKGRGAAHHSLKERSQRIIPSLADICGVPEIEPHEL